MSNRIERFIEQGLFASRWLMAPFYIGLVGALIVLLFSFLQELLHFIMSIPTLKFFKGGKLVDKQVGAVPKHVLANKLNAQLA